MSFEVQPGHGGQQPPLPQEAPWQAGGGQQPFEDMCSVLKARRAICCGQSLHKSASLPCCRCASAAGIWWPLHRGTVATAATGTSAAAILGWLCAAVPRPAGKLLPASHLALVDIAVRLAAGFRPLCKSLQALPLLPPLPLLNCSSLLADACWPCTAAISADVPAESPSAAASSAAASWLEPIRPVPAELCLLRPAASGDRWLNANGVRSS